MFLLKWRPKFKEEQHTLPLENEQLLGQIEVAADQLKAVIEQVNYPTTKVVGLQLPRSASGCYPPSFTWGCIRAG
ncbi:hypothetical protein [Anoxybacillus sp. J5B_2022]|uniref:hypothetical protein n=1 Tax=Anoxybacillus sp. J5B_2022 TaxID=3003246 RepID=UPI00228642A7|nr:hypothetical protein [Anoxybacillus sp. J5B_2022]MCZ0755091.1 hypothetical protein [Anoxybacillus sp. J5B_2022]